MSDLSFDITSLHRAYASGLRPADVIDTVFQRLAAADDPGIFIHHAAKEALVSEAAALGPFDPSAKPLWGIPCAIKDNIDVAGMPTTAGCPDYAYLPDRDATVVALLKAAGALVVGKTNLDQFATGLVGVRTPYPIPRNAVDRKLVPGGSSSGSAVATSRGIVSFALGTDTAGSGRIPAGLNNIVGLKPTIGALSAAGVVPACRTLDCVSIFALTADDAYTVFSVAARKDAADPYSKSVPIAPLGPRPPVLTVGVPGSTDRKFFGDMAMEAGFEAALVTLEVARVPSGRAAIPGFLRGGGPALRGGLGCRTLRCDRRLPGGAPGFASPRHAEDHRWCEEAFSRRCLQGHLRAAGSQSQDRAGHCLGRSDLRAHCPDALHRRAGAHRSDRYQQPARHLHQFRQPARSLRHRRADGRAVRRAADERDVDRRRWKGWPRRRSRTRHTGGRRLTLGATGLPLRREKTDPVEAQDGLIELAVVGAHLSGMPLNSQLKELGARFCRVAKTAAAYQLYALAREVVPKPGLVRVTGGAGAEVEVEIWRLAPDAFGRFVASIPPPLGIGTILLQDGTAPKGFLVEPAALDGALDISSYGGWRSYLARPT